jgi:hypothetical protein
MGDALAAKKRRWEIQPNQIGACQRSGLLLSDFGVTLSLWLK